MKSAGTALARSHCARAFGNETAGLQCENFGNAPPCASGEGRFFHLPFVQGDRTFKGMYAQCYGRPRDEDWPFLYDPWARSGPRTRTVTEVDQLLGDRTITFVGASDTAHVDNWIQCHLARAGLRKPKGCRWRHWGWAVLEADNCECKAGWGELIGCTSGPTEGYSVDAMLCAVDPHTESADPDAA